MPGPNPTPPPEETPEQRDERVAAENEEARLARDVELAKTEYANALRVHGYDRDIPAEVERAFEPQRSNESAADGDDTESAGE
jgi:hypothetical protein